MRSVCHAGSSIFTVNCKPLSPMQLEDSKNNFKYQHGEIFKRMKCSTFIQLVIQVRILKPCISLHTFYLLRATDLKNEPKFEQQTNRSPPSVSLTRTNLRLRHLLSSVPYHLFKMMTRPFLLLPDLTRHPTRRDHVTHGSVMSYGV